MRRLTALLLALLLAATAQSAVVVPVEIANTRIHIPVAVGKNAPANFVLDTGAGASPLDAEYAKQLGIRGNSTGQANGAAGSVSVRFASSVPYRIAGIDHQSKRVPLIPFEAVSLRAGRPLDGILGSDVFKRFVTEIDYFNQQVTFFKPREHKPSANATAIPIDFHNGIPRVKAKLTFADGRTINATLLVDTGAGHGVVLARRFHEKHNIAVEGFEGVFGLGVGGEAKQRVTRIPSIEFGAFRFENPVTLFSYATRGALDGAHMDGLIGGEILRRFTLTVDYPNKRFLLVPNQRYSEPFDFDMSGALLTTRDASYTTIEIFHVIPASPAAEAGLRVGDVLRTIDGVEATPARLNEIRLQMRQPGKTYTFTVVRDGVEQQIAFTTRRLV